MGLTLFIVFTLIATWILNCYISKFWVWSVSIIFLLLIFNFINLLSNASFYILFVIWICITACLIYPKLRAYLLFDFLWKKLKKNIKPISNTEQIAISSGDTWFEDSLLKGSPDWKLFKKSKLQELSKQEKLFVSNQTEKLLEKLDDWKLKKDIGLPKDIWSYIKDNGFMGLVISKEYGGMGFSAYAHSEIVKRVALKSLSAAITIMVPNSLGPGELIQKYGTQDQKDLYLKKLAQGVEVPCFALTGPLTGSDATNMPDKGVVCYRKHRGKDILGLLLNFDKRYITLAPIATLIGLAIDVIDPDNLLPENIKSGITLCLLPANTPGVKIGDYHLPLNVKFNNGVISGNKVFIPITQVIGGVDKVGHGWKMLTDCLSEGRALSLPSLSSASSSISFLSSSSYSLIRRQFNRPILDFPGVSSKVVNTAGLYYLIESLRQFALIPVSNGLKPSVISGMAKYFSTELSRDSLQDAMDIHGGKAIIDGPSNYLARLYDAAPISITVEGANLLTRNMMIFGQGVMRSHPTLKELFNSILNDDKNKYYKLCNKQISYFIRNISRLFFGSLFYKGLNYKSNYYKQINLMSLRLNILVDICLMLYGPKIKIKERISARLSDIWGYLVLASSIIKYNNSNKDKLNNLLLKWSFNYCMYQAQEAMYSLFNNFGVKYISLISRVLFPWGRVYNKSSDKLDLLIANELKKESNFRSKIVKDLNINSNNYPLLNDLEEAFQKYNNLKDVFDIINDAIKSDDLDSNVNQNLILEEALSKNIINKSMAKRWQEFIDISNKIIAVDVFSSNKKTSNKVKK